MDVPFSSLKPEHLELITNGVPERKFGGLKGFFAWLERRKYKMHIRVFLSRWRSYRSCPACGGARLRPEALATRVGAKNLAELSNMKISDAARFFRDLTLSDHERQVARIMLEQVRARLSYLEAVGLGYLSLDRTLHVERRRDAAWRYVGSGVEPGQHALRAGRALDRPHPRDISRLVDVIKTCATGRTRWWSWSTKRP